MNQKPSPINIVPDNAASSTAIPDDAHRCHYRTTTGRRCRGRLANPRASLCVRHQRLDTERNSADLAASLMGDHRNFATVEGIGSSLNDLYLLLARNRITPRRAAVLAYINNSLFHVIQAIDKKQKDTPPTVVFGRREPSHDTKPDTDTADADKANPRPAPTYAKLRT